MGLYARKLVYGVIVIMPFFLGCGVADQTFGDLRHDGDPFDSRGDYGEAVDVAADDESAQGCGPGEGDAAEAEDPSGAGGGAGVGLPPDWSW